MFPRLSLNLTHLNLNQSHLHHSLNLNIYFFSGSILHCYDVLFPINACACTKLMHDMRLTKSSILTVLTAEMGFDI